MSTSNIISCYAKNCFGSNTNREHLTPIPAPFSSIRALTTQYVVTPNSCWTCSPLLIQNLKWSLICFEIQVLTATTILLFHKCILSNHKQLIKYIHRANKMCTLPFLCELSTFFVAKNFLLPPRGKGQNTSTAQVLEAVTTMHRIPPILLNEQTVRCVCGSRRFHVSLPLKADLSGNSQCLTLCLHSSSASMQQWRLKRRHMQKELTSILPPWEEAEPLCHFSSYLKCPS